MPLLMQSLLNGRPHPLFDHVNVVVVDHQISAQVLDASAVLSDDLGLVRGHGDGLHSAEHTVFRGNPVCGVASHGYFVKMFYLFFNSLFFCF